MRVTVLELAASYGEPVRALGEIDARLAAGGPTDLVVVPEAALHGYVSPVTIAVCYDLHFIAGDAADALDAANLLLFPSAWVERPDTRAGRLAAIAPHAPISSSAGRLLRRGHGRRGRRE